MPREELSIDRRARLLHRALQRRRVLRAILQASSVRIPPHGLRENLPQQRHEPELRPRALRRAEEVRGRDGGAAGAERLLAEDDEPGGEGETEEEGGEHEGVVLPCPRDGVRRCLCRGRRVALAGAEVAGPEEGHETRAKREVTDERAPRCWGAGHDCRHEGLQGMGEGGLMRIVRVR